MCIDNIFFNKNMLNCFLLLKFVFILLSLLLLDFFLDDFFIGVGFEVFFDFWVGVFFF